MNGPDPADVWDEVLNWLRVADVDQRTARLCTNAQPPMRDVAAFHCQQAAEKLLKAFLVRASADFSKTHDIGPLGREVCRHFPAVAPTVLAMEDWTEWNIAWRYPGVDGPEPEPSAEELDAALDLIGDLAETLRALGPPPGQDA